MMEYWDLRSVIHLTLLKIQKRIASTSAEVLKQASHLLLHNAYENHQKYFAAGKCTRLSGIVATMLQCYIPAKPINFRGRYFNESGTLSTIHSVFDTIVEICLCKPSIFSQKLLIKQNSLFANKITFSKNLTFNSAVTGDRWLPSSGSLHRITSSHRQHNKLIFNKCE